MDSVVCERLCGFVRVRRSTKQDLNESDIRSLNTLLALSCYGETQRLARGREVAGVTKMASARQSELSR